MPADPLAFPVTLLDGRPFDLAACRGKVLLIVNTASQCGFTPQYAGLEALWQRYRDQGLVVLGFPCNQFGQQEPGDAAAIGAFCQKNYGVSFPMAERCDVNGAQAHPLWQHLTRSRAGLFGSRRIKWNFTKFLIGRDGQVRGRYGPLARPASLDNAIRDLLAQ